MTILRKIEDAQIQGAYKETEMDRRKKESNRLVSVCGKYKTIILENGEQINFVNNLDFAKWTEKNKYIADF